MPVDTEALISNISQSYELYNVSTCASLVITVNARTTVGFNDTLTLNEIVIPSSVEGLLQYR